jgi:hypothetical protein
MKGNLIPIRKLPDCDIENYIKEVENFPHIPFVIGLIFPFKY